MPFAVCSEEEMAEDMGILMGQEGRELIKSQIGAAGMAGAYQQQGRNKRVRLLLNFLFWLLEPLTSQRGAGNDVICIHEAEVSSTLR